MITKFAAALAALGMIVGLSACTSSGNGSTPTSSAAPSSSSKTSGGPTKKASSVPVIPSQHALPNPSKIANSVTLRKQVAITKCVSTAKGWAAAGNVVNTGRKKALDVDITVFFTTSSATVLDYATTKVRVEPGRTSTWKASADFRTTKNMRCVLRGVG